MHTLEDLNKMEKYTEEFANLQDELSNHVSEILCLQAELEDQRKENTVRCCQSLAFLQVFLSFILVYM